MSNVACLLPFALLALCVKNGIAAELGYKIESAQEFGGADVLEISNKDGELVALTEIHLDQDYQVIKPLTKGDHVCLITNTREGDYSKKCNVQEPFIPNSEEEKEKVAALCGTRQVYILKPESCEALGTGGRLKRANCSYKKVPKTYCLKEETYCTRFGWWQCKSWATRCTQSEIRDEIVQDCH